MGSARRRGRGDRAAEPRGTAQATLGGATLEVTYSRPARRGREIWGGLVPYGEVWRTGANAATVLTTDHDLVLGGQGVTAGSYSLWTEFGPESAELIVNAQSGQWGTAHDPAQDLFRVPLERSAAGEPAERFTIAIDEETSALRLTWDDRTYSVPIEVR